MSADYAATSPADLEVTVREGLVYAASCEGFPEGNDGGTGAEA